MFDPNAKNNMGNMNNQEIVVLYLILTPRCLLTAYKSKSHHQKSELTRVHLNIYVYKYIIYSDIYIYIYSAYIPMYIIYTHDM